MPEIQIPSFIITGLQVILAFGGAFFLALWLSLIIWTFRDARLRSRDVFAIMLATLMVVVFGPLGLLLYFLLRPPVTLAELYERSLEEEALLQDLEERPRCPGCSRQVDEAWIVCPDCHTTLKKICPNCQKSLNLRWNICPFCGVLVSGAPTGGPDQHNHSSGEVITETRPMGAVSTAPVAAPPFYGGDETRPHRPEVEPA
ncbi:MAG: zinc ribbon domain-containing protein [Anaerolineae bacterium]